MNLSEVFKKIGAGLTWIPKEVGKLFSRITKLITVTEDAKKLSSDVLPKLLTLLDCVRIFVTATIKDGGAFLSAIASLGTAVTAAAESGLTNLIADEAVLIAFKNLVSLIQQTHVADILSAWKALVNAAHDLEETAAADLKQLEADVMGNTTEEPATPAPAMAAV